jgi:tape measure domain-containing protein
MAVLSSNEIHVKYVLDTSQLQAATQAMSGITAEERKLLADLKKLQDQLNATGKAGANAGGSIADSFGNLGSVIKTLIPAFGALFVIDKLKQFAQYAFDVAIQFEQMGKTLAFVTGSSIKANEQLSYMTALSQSLGLNVQSLIDGYKSFAAAASFAGVSQQQINAEMRAFAKASAALSLSADDTKLVFMALSQMYSKNKISAEELRQQLGERLPGAMELLAKSMKIPVGELDVLMRKGDIITKEVMPNFAKEIEVAFGTAADNTSTLTAKLNAFYTSLETAIVSIMSGGIGDSIKWLLDRMAAISDMFKWLAQNTAENELDYYNKRKVNVEKNVLYEIEKIQKLAKEKEGIELSVTEAAQRALDDRKTGTIAFYKFQQDTYNKAAKELGQADRPYLLGFLDSVKRFSLNAGVMAKASINTLLSPIEMATRGTMNVLMENMVAAKSTYNQQTENLVSLARTRNEELQRLADEGKAAAQQKSDEEAEKEGKALKNRYAKELQMLELQEKIRKLYAEARTDDAYKLGQELLRIEIEFNSKKKSVDDKYYQESLKSETEVYKDLRELTSNNANLRTAEQSKMNADLRRNTEKYHKEAYDKAVKDYEQINDAALKAAGKSEKITKTKFEKEIEESDKNYSDLIRRAEDKRDEVLKNEAIEGDKKKVLIDSYGNLLNNLWDSKEKARVDITKKYNDIDMKERVAYWDKIRKEQFNSDKKDLDSRLSVMRTNADTMMLQEENFAKARGDDEQKLNLLYRKQSQERIDNQIYEKQKIYDLNVQYSDVDKKDRSRENEQILADIKNLEEQKNTVEIEYEEKRKAYRIQVMKEVANLSNTIVSGMLDLRNQQLEKELGLMQENADEEVRLADGNTQKIMAIREKQKQEERKIKLEQFRNQQTQAIAEVVFRTAPIIAEQLSGVVTAPLAILTGLIAGAQIANILAQPVPNYEKGTRNKRHKGGAAIVGEVGIERVVTESGQVYYTPPTATLLDLPKGSQVIPNNMLSKEELYWASSQGKAQPRKVYNPIEGKLDEIGSILKGLPIHQINMDERGFEKFIRTERRSTKILNNRFPQKGL